jgi:hypothetical protein
MRNTYSLLLPGLLLCGSLRVFGARISTDYDHSANFSRYKTYSWLKVKAGDSLLEDRIEQDVDKELGAKGWTRVDSNGDASIFAFQSTQDQQTLETFYNSFGGGWRWRGFGDSITTTTTDITKSGTVLSTSSTATLRNSFGVARTAMASAAILRRMKRSSPKILLACSNTSPRHTDNPFLSFHQLARRESREDKHCKSQIG